MLPALTSHPEPNEARSQALESSRETVTQHIAMVASTESNAACRAICHIPAEVTGSNVSNVDCAKSDGPSSGNDEGYRRRYGYWRIFSNVAHELFSFLETRPDLWAEMRMPTQRDLKLGGCVGLKDAFKLHGGTAAVAARLGLQLGPKGAASALNCSASRRRPRRYWLEFANVEAELKQFMATHNVEGRMPTLYEIRKGGESFWGSC
mmetsp:Transcript_23595/g.51226  ORF Transcript_23595/g.51226 Transcript_23595/m.51226 type:complete len:207 (+) Transcript_23595:2-622(+)